MLEHKKQHLQEILAKCRWHLIEEYQFFLSRITMKLGVTNLRARGSWVASSYRIIKILFVHSLVFVIGCYVKLYLFHLDKFETVTNTKKLLAGNAKLCTWCTMLGVWFVLLFMPLLVVHCFVLYCEVTKAYFFAFLLHVRLIPWVYESVSEICPLYIPCSHMGPRHLSQKPKSKLATRRLRARNGVP